MSPRRQASIIACRFVPLPDISAPIRIFLVNWIPLRWVIENHLASISQHYFSARINLFKTRIKNPEGYAFYFTPEGGSLP